MTGLITNLINQDYEYFRYQDQGLLELEREKEKLKQKYPGITDDDLHYRDGKEMVMIEILSYKLGKTRHEMGRILADL